MRQQSFFHRWQSGTGSFLAAAFFVVVSGSTVSVQAQTVAQATSGNGTGAAPNLLDPNFKPTPKPQSTSASTDLSPTAVSIPAAVQTAFNNGAYSLAAKLGAAALVEQPKNASLRLLVANSLSWSGRLDAAYEQYDKLLNTPLAAAAKVGQGNLQRWRGKPVQAEALYNAVLKVEPTNADALEGLRLSQRELRAQWNKSLGFADDSTKFRRLESTTSFRTYSDDRSYRWGIGDVLGKDLGAPTANKYAEINGHLQWLNSPAKPRVDLSVADGFNKTRLYGLVSLDAFNDNVSVRAGFINWGRKSFNTAAQAAHLTAKQIGAAFNWRSDLGDLRLRGDYYAVSDTNKVWDAEATFNPAWQPLPADLKWYTGAYTKQAKRTQANYWSPARPYTLGLLGLKKAWYFDNGDLSVGLQGGFKLTEEAKNNFGLSASGKYWISDKSALGFDLWSSNSPRQTDYKQRVFSINLQQLW
jgi:tetratricopeptide (TPR) repeat protein